MRNKKYRDEYVEPVENLMEESAEETRDAAVAEEIMEEVTDESFEEPSVEESNTGIVVNCWRLRLRKLPSKESEVVKLLDGGEGVFVDLEKSTEEWLKVRTTDGEEGFCMKDYIEM